MFSCQRLQQAVTNSWQLQLITWEDGIPFQTGLAWGKPSWRSQRVNFQQDSPCKSCNANSKRAAIKTLPECWKPLHIPFHSTPREGAPSYTEAAKMKPVFREKFLMWMGSPQASAICRALSTPINAFSTSKSRDEHTAEPQTSVPGASQWSAIALCSQNFIKKLYGIF